MTHDSIELLDADMDQRNLKGFWRYGGDVVALSPETNVQPHLWRWTDVHETLLRAGDVIDLEQAERRVVALVNPGIPGARFTSNTLQMTFQYVKPGERARAHRHTIGALRFVVKGSGTYTTVNGQQCVMEEGDLILTPNMTWHNHVNDSSEPIIWIDGLDSPLVKSLQQIVFEPYPEDVQEIETSSDLVNAQVAAGRAPAPGQHPFRHFKGRDTWTALEQLVNGGALHPFDGYLLEIRNPVTGGPTLPSIQCAVQQLPAGFQSRAHRQSTTTLYHVVRGSGTTIIGDQRFDWVPGDTFVVPLWYPHQHLNQSSEDAVLFSMSDAPLLKALDLYREQAVD